MPIQVSTAAEALVGSWDDGRPCRVLANVLDNVVKYSPHGGEIEVESEMGVGTLVTVRLPLLRRAHLTASSVRRSRSLSGRS